MIDNLEQIVELQERVEKLESVVSQLIGMIDTMADGNKALLEIVKLNEEFAKSNLELMNKTIRKETT